MILRILLIAIALLAIGGCTDNRSARQNNAVRPANAGSPSSSATPGNTGAPPPTSERTGERVGSKLDYGFEAGIPEGWEKLDPDPKVASGWDFAEGRLILTIPSDKDLFGGNRTAPRLLKAVTGDFEIETRLRFSPKSDYQGAGLLIFRNDNNFLRLERGFGGVGGGNDGIRFDRAEDESYDAIATPEKFATSAPNVDLKLRRQGKHVAAFWRETGTQKWIEVGNVLNNYPETVLVGIIGVNTGNPIKAEFSYLKLSPAETRSQP